MLFENIKSVVEKNYELNVIEIENIKNVYKITTSYGIFCLKVIHYELRHFIFILSAINHLQSQGFSSMPKIIKTKNQLDYISFNNKYAYLTPWINARICDYNDVLDINLATKKLAELHIKSKNFIVTKDMKPRIGWLKWMKTFKTRKHEILDFKYRINNKYKKSKFDEIYLGIMEDELKRVDRSIKNLGDSNYIDKMKKEILDRGFCHHDYAYHNILIDKNNSVNIIDFDYCILDTHLHDLASILIRCMKYGKWHIKKAEEILCAYDSINKIEKDDIYIILSFMEFPQDYWQRGIQYYWEEKPWGEEFFVKKLKKYIEDREQKQQFIDEFRNYIC